MIKHLDPPSPITSRVIEKLVFAAFYALEQSADENEYTEVIQFDTEPGETLSEEEVRSVAIAIFSHPYVENAANLDISVTLHGDSLTAVFYRLGRVILAQ